MSASVHHQSVAMQKLLLQLLHFTIFAFKVRMVRLFSVTVRWRLRPMQLQVEHPCWKDWSLQRVHLSHHWLLGRSHPQSCLCHMPCASSLPWGCVAWTQCASCILHVLKYPMLGQIPMRRWIPAVWGCPFCSPKLSLSFLAQPRCYFVPRNAEKMTKKHKKTSICFMLCFMLLHVTLLSLERCEARVCTCLHSPGRRCNCTATCSFGPNGLDVQLRHGPSWPLPISLRRKPRKCRQCRKDQLKVSERRCHLLYKHI